MARFLGFCSGGSSALLTADQRLGQHLHGAFKGLAQSGLSHVGLRAVGQ